KGPRGRLSKRQRRERERVGATKKEQAYFIWTHRHLVVKRPEDFSGTDRANFQQMLRALPGLWTLLYFVLQIYRLFEPDLTSKEGCRRRTALVKTAEFQANEHLARALAMLPLKKFRKMIAYVHSPAGQRVRTNNHVERVNRQLRYFEKVRYKWRRRRTIVRFLVLALDLWRQRHIKAQDEERRIKADKQKRRRSDHRAKSRC